MFETLLYLILLPIIVFGFLIFCVLAEFLFNLAKHPKLILGSGVLAYILTRLKKGNDK